MCSELIKHCLLQVVMKCTLCADFCSPQRIDDNEPGIEECKQKCGCTFNQYADAISLD